MHPPLAAHLHDKKCQDVIQQLSDCHIEVIIEYHKIVLYRKPVSSLLIYW